MSRRLRLAAAVVAVQVASFGAPGGASAGPVLDGLLDGLERGCARTKAFRAWEDGLIGRFMPMADPSPTPGSPRGYEAAIGEAQGFDKGGHIRVVVPMAGTYRGFAVKRLSFAFGKADDLHVYAVEFAEPAAVIAEAFGPAVTAGARALAARGGTTSLDLDGRVAVVCELAEPATAP